MPQAAEPTRVRLQRDAPWSGEIDRHELLDLHRMLMEEYRFQVKLNSDRTQNYLVLNAAILAAATGLLKLGGTERSPLVTAILILGVVVAFIAARAAKQGHEYYRAIVYKKTLVEHLLGRHQHIEGYAYRGATLAIETTAGMSNEGDILDNAEAWLSRPVRNATVTGGLIWVFRMMLCVDAFAALYTGMIAIINIYHAW